MPQTVTNGYTWGMMALAIAVLLLLWHERNRAGGYLQTSKVNAQFIAAAETSPDAFTIMESVRDKAGEIAGFRYLYVNYHAEKLLRRPRVEVLEREMCELFPTDSTHELCEKYRNVVLSGEPLGEELCIPLDNGKERWFRRRIIKLDDGVAVTASDVTKIKNNEERYRSLTNFSNSIFETAPVSIIETDLGGMIRAMNGAAEKLTGYTRAEMVGKISSRNCTTLMNLTNCLAKTRRRTTQGCKASVCLRRRQHWERWMRGTVATFSGTVRPFRCMSR